MSDRMRFWKMSGAGNDFIVLDGRDPLPAAPADLARRLCPRRVSVGADGLLVLTPRGDGGVDVDYVNADGSPAEFCGNGARCAARFASVRGIAGESVELHFGALRVTASVAPGEVSVTTGRPRIVGRATWPGPDDVPIEAVRVHAGVEHAVVSGAPSSLPLDVLRASLARSHPALSAGLNVTTVRELGDGRLAVRTHERGSGATMSCGSGAIAAVATQPGADSGLERVVLPPAGIPLVVTIEPAPGPVRLRGEARLVYEGSVLLGSG